jgi:hypothetical protein
VKRSDVYKEFEFYTGKASDVVRQLALAGFALIWLFKRDTSTGPVVPIEFRFAAVLLLLAILFDFLQYSVASVVWERYKNQFSAEPPASENQEIIPPDRIYYPGAFFYYAKIVALVIGYVALLIQFGANKSIFA